MVIRPSGLSTRSEKLESYLARSGLSELLTKKVGDTVERDDYVAPSSTGDEVISEEVKQI